MQLLLEGSAATEAPQSGSRHVTCIIDPAVRRITRPPDLVKFEIPLVLALQPLTTTPQTTAMHLQSSSRGEAVLHISWGQVEPTLTPYLLPP